MRRINLKTKKVFNIKVKNIFQNIQIIKINKEYNKIVYKVNKRIANQFYNN